MFTAVSIATRSVVRRTDARRKSRTGQSSAADFGSRRSFRRWSHSPSGMSSRPITKNAGTTTKTRSPAYGWSNHPANSAITSVTNTSPDTVVIAAPMIASGLRASSSGLVTGAYFRLAR